MLYIRNIVVLFMPIFRTVKAIPSGGSKRITLPAAWTKQHGVKTGDDLQLLDHGVLIVFPPKLNSKLDIDALMRDIRATLFNFVKK